MDFDQVTEWRADFESMSDDTQTIPFVAVPKNSFYGKSAPIFESIDAVWKLHFGMSVFSSLHLLRAKMEFDKVNSYV